MPAPRLLHICRITALLLLVFGPGCAVTEPTDQDIQRVRSLIEENPRIPIGVLAGRLGVSDAAVLAALPESKCREVPRDQWRPLLTDMSTWGKVQLRYQDGEHRVTYEAEGIGLTMPSPESLHIGSAGLAVDLRDSDLHSLWLIDKPANGPQRGLIVCDEDGRALFRFMLLYETGPGFSRAWEAAKESSRR